MLVLHTGYTVGDVNPSCSGKTGDFGSKDAVKTAQRIRGIG